MSARRFGFTLFLAALAASAPASAQEVAVRGFGDVGITSFTASRSFEAIFDTAIGSTFGGGGEVVLPAGIFGRLHASRFRRTGERVFVVDEQVFPLGIETTVTITPVVIAGGYRFGRGRVVPYAGGGIGWHRLQETDEFATADDEVDQTSMGYHALGGAEVRISRWLGAAFEAEWATVPDALGQNPNSVSAAYGETDLGGMTVRARIVIGR